MNFKEIRHYLLSLALIECEAAKGHDCGEWEGNTEVKGTDKTWTCVCEFTVPEAEEWHRVGNWEPAKERIRLRVAYWNKVVGEKRVICKLRPSIDNGVPNDTIRMYFMAVVRLTP
jgi:hypothetical protein